ncbi:hypothetical protein ACTJI8_12890 [Microbacterium sp. 22303]|uniref:hypothetical protein n=1 Tax=Microbacterium sp. 22303 TaxID=3453905 RepID=UPI003F8480CC
MKDLREAIQPEEPEDEVMRLGLALAGMVPLVGPFVTEGAAHVVQQRVARRNRENFEAIVLAVEELWRALDSQMTLEEIVASDAFVAGFERAMRVAGESESAAKRQRLANAVATAALDPNFDESERDGYMQLVERYSDLHVWLLAFYCNPVGWLRGNGMEGAADDMIRGGLREEPLNDALRVDRARAVPAVTAALEDLQRDSVLGAFQLTESVGDRKQFNPQTTRRGRRLLRFIREEHPDQMQPPMR